MVQKKNGIFKLQGAAILAIAALALCGYGTSAMAVIITAGQTLSTTGETSPAFGAPVYDSGNVSFNGVDNTHTVVFSGELDSKVYTDPSTGHLDFVYLFSNDAGDGDYILSFATSSYSGLTTDADYVTGTGATSPATVQRNAPNSGGTLDFEFPAGIAPGTAAAEIIVKTNAINYSLNGTAAFEDGGNVTFAAPAAVPEPATAAIAGFSMLALAMRRRRANRI